MSESETHRCTDVDATDGFAPFNPSYVPGEVRMFEWAKRKAGGKFIANDVQKTLTEVRSLPGVLQRVIALSAIASISAAVDAMQKTTVANLDQVFVEYLSQATATRQRAVVAGAVNYRDPEWAAAALAEAWLLTSSPKFDRKVFERINAQILGWAQTVLTPAEMASLGH